MTTQENLTAFVRKIADGKLLMRFSFDDCNVTCDCCGSEQHIVYSPDFPDTLQHKPWCIVTAARTLFPEFTPADYPDDHVHGMRRWGNFDGHNAQPHFAWLEEERK